MSAVLYPCPCICSFKLTEDHILLLLFNMLSKEEMTIASTLLSILYILQGVLAYVE